MLNQKEESFVNEENIEEIADNQLINKEDIKLDKNTSLSKEEIELHEEELKKLIEEKLALQKAKANVAKEVADKAAMIKENFNRKLKNIQESMQHLH